MKKWLYPLLALPIFLLHQLALADVSADKLVEKNAHKVLQLEIYNRKTEEKISTGSGFFINNSGLLASNYHVVSRHVFSPEDYAIRIVHSDGHKTEAEVVDIDIVNDLSILQSSSSRNDFFQLSKKPPNKGVQLYSLGNPLDLGMIVAEGNYNGLVKKMFTDRINFSGAINSGMSGGPVIDENANVVGINVTTRKNQLGGLVPVDKLSAMLSRVNKHSGDATKNFPDQVTSQLIAHQKNIFEPILALPWPEKKINNSQVIGKVADFLTCGTKTNKSNEKRKYESYYLFCHQKEHMYLNSSSRIQGFGYGFEFIESDSLLETQLSGLYRNKMKGKKLKGSIGSRYITNFHCNQGVVENRYKNDMKVSFCTRAYRKHVGLFDVKFSGVLLSDKKQTVIFKFNLHAVSKEIATRFASRFLEAIKWD